MWSRWMWRGEVLTSSSKDQLSQTRVSSTLPLPWAPDSLRRERKKGGRDSFQREGDGLRLLCFKHLCRDFEKNRLWETLRHLYYKQLPYCWNKLRQDLTLIISNVKQIYSQISMRGRAGRGRLGFLVPQMVLQVIVERWESSILCWFLVSQPRVSLESVMECLHHLQIWGKENVCSRLWPALEENYFLRKTNDIRFALDCCPVSKLKILGQSFISFCTPEQGLFILSAFFNKLGKFLGYSCWGPTLRFRSVGSLCSQAWEPLHLNFR